MKKKTLQDCTPIHKTLQELQSFWKFWKNWSIPGLHTKQNIEGISIFVENHPGLYITNSQDMATIAKFLKGSQNYVFLIPKYSILAPNPSSFSPSWHLTFFFIISIFQIKDFSIFLVWKFTILAQNLCWSKKDIWDVTLFQWCFLYHSLWYNLAVYLALWVSIQTRQPLGYRWCILLAEEVFMWGKNKR